MDKKCVDARLFILISIYGVCIFMNKLFKRLFLVLFIGISNLVTVYASENCFIAIENDKVVKQVGKCDSRFSPYSTFKIPLALMGFDSGILKSPDEPKVEFTPEMEESYLTYYNPEKYPNMLLWKRAQTPQTWMRDSVIWYSRYITHKLGTEKFQEYVNKFNYGNKNIEGEEGADDGLMNSWIHSSLEISPMEQVMFIKKLANKSLPVSKNAQENTIKIIKMESIFDGWQLYAKGGGSLKIRWFVGWIEKDKRRVVFVQLIELPEDPSVDGQSTVKEVAKDGLISLVNKK